MMRRWLVVAGFLVVGSLAAPPAAAQFFSFGQNKIQYRGFDWQVIHGPHVDLYYYPEEEHIAGVALEYAEASYDTLKLRFGHEVSTRIPLIVYASHVDFSQTNILPFVPPEGILGVTDFLKHRISMPFRGNLYEFFATLRHEMVHVFQMGISVQAYNRAPRLSRPFIPLWWSEGLAEWWSFGENARDEMVIRDLVLTGKMPSLEQLSFVRGGLEYPLGGRIHRWLAKEYGDWRVAVFYREMWRYATFEEAIFGIYGKTLDQLSEEFRFAMMRYYSNAIEERMPLSVAGTKVADRAINATYVAGSAKDGGEVVYLAPGNGYISIYLENLRTGRRGKVITGGRSEDYESFHPFSSRLDASREGYLLFSSQRHERDALVIWNLVEGNLAGRYQFPDITSILSPKWAPDGLSIFFSGLSDAGISDLYRVWLPDGRVDRLTEDRYQDLDPTPSPDGTRLVWASDRTAGGLDGAKNLFVMDLATKDIRQITYGMWVDETPVWAGSGRVYFASDRDGILNVFSIDEFGAGRRETSAWTGAFAPSYVPEKDGLVVSGYHRQSLNVYFLPPDAEAERFTFAPPTMLEEHSRWQWPTSDETEAMALQSEPYERRMTVDIAAAEAVAIPGFGAAQGAAIVFSDLLNDDVIVGSISTYSGPTFSDIFDNINISAYYINRRRRVNWGLGVFRTNGTAFEAGSRFASYVEKAIGGVGLLSYPLNRFNRIEAQLQVAYSDRFDFILAPRDPRRTGIIVSNFVSFIRDNSLWTPVGPIDGGRFSITAGVSKDFTNARFDSFLLTVDWRRYFRIAANTAYALRVIGWYSGGDRPTRINIGGTHAIRGFPLFGEVTGTKAWMINNELRFPFLRYLTFGTPAGALRFPALQGALTFDLGQATIPNVTGRGVLGSAGAGLRWGLWPFAVVRMDVGYRFGSGFAAYGLSPNWWEGSYLQVWFGFDY